MNCSYDNDTLRCVRCGHQARRLPSFRECRPPGARPSQWKPVDVGKAVERGLRSVGITKELVSKLTGTENKPGGCGCGARQQWLTDVGNAAQYAVRDGFLELKKFYLGD